MSTLMGGISVIIGEIWTHQNAYIYSPLVVAAFFLYVVGRKRRRQYPPGPKGWPIIGNLFDVPKHLPWFAFAEWSKIYGDVVHLNVLGTRIIVLNSMKSAKELLDKRSAIYCDRPKLQMASLCGFDRTFTLKCYGPELRQQRKLVVHEFNPTHCQDYYRLQDIRAATLVEKIIESPSRLNAEVNFQIGSIILRAAYGYTAQAEDDPWLKTGLQMMHEFDIATRVGTFAVDFVPWLKYVPEWFPGAGFKKQARLYRNNHDRVVWEPLAWSKENWESGKLPMPNMCGNYIKAFGGKLDEESEKRLAYSLPGVVGGGLDTNVATALSFFMAMILYPDVQKKAQTELDRVIGTDRLPSVADKHNLPYIRSIMAEVYRWAPAVPLITPHSPSQDDEYEGMFIPKGSMVMPNVWNILHDPDTFPDPMTFLPERFDGSDSEMDKIKHMTFGFGRRMCPGMYFADGTFFAIVATTLATCDILPGLDENGKEALPKYAYTSSLVSFPLPFDMRLRIRSPRAASSLAEMSRQSFD